MKHSKLMLALISLLLAALLFACENGDDPTEEIQLPSQSDETQAPTGTSPETPLPEATAGTLSYTLLDNGTYEVSMQGISKETKIEIPGTYEGKQVTAVAANAFYMHRELM